MKKIVIYTLVIWTLSLIPKVFDLKFADNIYYNCYFGLISGLYLGSLIRLLFSKSYKEAFMQLEGLNNISKEIHTANVEKGFYEEKPSIDRSLMLIIGEISEAHEALRKGKNANLKSFEQESMQDFFKTNFEMNIKDTFEDEIADTMIRLFDFCGFAGIDIEKHIELKLQYNKLRPHKHGKKF